MEEIPVSIILINETPIEAGQAGGYILHLRQQLAAAQVENESLRQQLNEATIWHSTSAYWEKECDDLQRSFQGHPNNPVREDNKMLKEQLVSSQLREQQLREAFSDFEWNKDEWGFITAVKEALALPQDTSALEAMIVKAGEVMRERCFAIGHSDSIDESIRALPGVTMKDLK
jgi:hypothetical protein